MIAVGMRRHARRGRSESPGAIGPRILGLDQPLAHGVQRGLRAVGDAELGEHVADVRLDRLLGDAELAGDPLVRTARARSASSTSRSRGVSALARPSPAGCAIASSSRAAIAGSSSASPACAARTARASSCGCDVLEQVAGRARLDRGQQPLVVGEARQHDHARARAAARAARASRRRRRAAASRGPSGSRPGAAARPRRTASSPSPASPTTSIPSCSSRNVRSPSRTTAWSSTTQDADRRQPRARPPAAPSCPRPAPERISSRPPSRSRALLHRGQPEAARAQLRVGGVEARAVVGDLEHEPAVAAAQPHARRAPRPRGAARCAAPPGRSAAPRGRAGRRRRHAVVELELDRHAVQPAAAPRRACAARRTSPSRSRSGGRSSRISERSSSSASRASVLQPRRPARAPPRRRASSSVAAASAVSTSANSFWLDRVVQLEREPVALVEDRQLAAALVQPRVGDRDRGVRGEQLDQLLVGVGERRPRPPCR